MYLLHVREDLMIEVEKLAKENRFDYLLVKARNQ
jgi:hypothetical protein